MLKCVSNIIFCSIFLFCSFHIKQILIASENYYLGVEHVPVVHPVYDFLLRFETRGFFPNNSLSALPLQRKEIIRLLENIIGRKSDLSAFELAVLDKYASEFGLIGSRRAVIFFSESDTTQLFFNRILTDDEKFIYHYVDSVNSVALIPLGSLESIFKRTDTDNKYVVFGNLGMRLYGTLSNSVGYYLQATNGAILTGDRTVAADEPNLRKNIKFYNLKSDFDFTESHIRFDKDWFYITIGRETRLWGAGLNQRLILSNNAPPMDMISAGARFKTFEYRFSYGSALGLSRDSIHSTGVELFIPDKYSVFHRFSIRPTWGEISFWENLVYSGRNIDLAYLNPLVFLKSVEHALRDRDNSVMGIDATIRLFNYLQLKGTFVLDDIIFSEIGKDFWSNKTAWNISLLASMPFAIDLGLEYSRIEPYTFSHFNNQNSLTNDSVLYSSYLQPNSDEISAKVLWWWGSRYPFAINISYSRHGENIYDEFGKLVRNVGGDVLQSRRHEDSDRVKFLDGNKIEKFNFEISTGYEIFRGLYIYSAISWFKVNDLSNLKIKLSLRYWDF